MKNRNRVFEQLIQKPEATKKWLLFTISVIFHGCLIAIVVIGPLISADENLPQVKTVNVYLTAPPAVPLPPAPPPAKGSSRALKKKNPRKKPEKPRNQGTGRLVQPFQIPDDIEEDGFDFGIGFGDPNGVEGGVPGGVPGGVLGSAFLDNDIDAGSNMMPMDIRKAVLLHRVEPVYPMTAIKAHVQGTVVLKAVTDVYGKVVRVDVIHGSPLLQTSAIQAVRQWIYEPHIVNGVPKPVTFLVQVNFSLQH